MLHVCPRLTSFATDSVSIYLEGVIDSLQPTMRSLTGFNWPAATLLLPAAFAAAVPACSWFAYDPNIAVAGYCTTNDAYYTAIAAEPTTFTAKRLTRVYGRQVLCSAAISEGACKALTTSLNCYWTGKKCDAREKSDWSWFARHVGRGLQPLSAILLHSGSVVCRCDYLHTVHQSDECLPCMTL